MINRMSFLKHIKPSVQRLEPYSVTGKPLSSDLIKLNQNENPYDVPDYIKHELLDSFFHQYWNRYPEVAPKDLIRSLSIENNVSYESIIAANGSNELMYTILTSIVTKGTKVLIPVPTFFLYEKIVTILDGMVIPVPANNDLSFNVDEIIKVSLVEKPSLIILNSPNSPTGQMLTLTEIEKIISSTEAIILVDEAYIEFADLPSIASLVDEYDRLVVLRTFSKAFSLAGLRIGYLIAQPALCTELMKLKIPFTVNNFSSAVAIRLLQQKELILERIQYIKTQKNFLFDELNRINEIKVFSSQANFLIFQVKKDAQVLFQRLLSENVLIRDVSSYPMLENTLRVNAGLESENNAFLSVLQKYL